MMDNYSEESLYSDDLTPEQAARRLKHQRDIDKKKEKEKRAAENAERRSKSIKKYLRVIVIVFVVVALLFGKMIFKIAELTEEKKQAQQELQQMQEEIQELQDTLEKVSTPEYIESQARALLRMIYPEEILYIVENE